MQYLHVDDQKATTTGALPLIRLAVRTALPFVSSTFTSGKHWAIERRVIRPNRIVNAVFFVFIGGS